MCDSFKLEGIIARGEHCRTVREPGSQGGLKVQLGRDKKRGEVQRSMRDGNALKGLMQQDGNVRDFAKRA